MGEREILRKGDYDERKDIKKMNKDEPEMKKSSLKIERERIGPSGIEEYLVAVDKLRGDKRTDEEQLRDKEEREFEIKCALGKNFLISDEIQCSIPEGYGESYLLMPKDEEESIIHTHQGKYHVLKNTNNEISLISLACSAHSWQEAFNKFFLGITPFLDFLSYQADIPIVIQKIYCRDKKNNLSVVSYRAPYPKVILKPHAKELREEFFPLYSLYREAKNSFSNYYRFLCYYKIIEGIFRYMRPSLMSKARKQGIKIVTRKELVPSHPELVFFQKKYVGKPIKTLFDNKFTPEYRNTVVHFTLKSSAILNPSGYYSIVKFADIILLSDLCAREVLKTQHDYHIQFEKGGGKY